MRRLSPVHAGRSSARRAHVGYSAAVAALIVSVFGLNAMPYLRAQMPLEFTEMENELLPEFPEEFVEIMEEQGGAAGMIAPWGPSMHPGVFYEASLSLSAGGAGSIGGKAYLGQSEDGNSQMTYVVQRNTTASMGEIPDEGDPPEPEEVVAIENEMLMVPLEEDDIEQAYMSNTRYNFFLGDDPALWRTNVQLSNALVARGSNVVTTYSLRGGQMEATYTIAAGVDPASILQFAIRGSPGAISLSPSGDLLIPALSDGTTLTLAAPESSQKIGPEGGETKAPVDSEYVLLGTAPDGAQLFGIQLTGPHDISEPVIIDPLLGATYLGGSGLESGGVGTMLKARENDAVYMVGTTASSDFPASAGVQPTLSQANDVVIGKFNNDLTELISATYLGGTSSENYPRLTISDAGDVYVTGRLSTPGTFPVRQTSISTPTGSISTTCGAGRSFLAHLSGDLDELYQSFCLTSGQSNILNLTTDNAGHVYVAGSGMADVPTTAGTYQPALAGVLDGFILKLDSELSGITAGTFIGGSSIDDIDSILIAPNGNVVIKGTTISGNFPIANPATAYQNFNRGGAGSRDNYVAVLQGSLMGPLVASTYIGGSSEENRYLATIYQANQLAIDATGNIYITGDTISNNYPVLNVSGSAYMNSNDVFVSKFSPTLQLLASRYLGGPQSDFIPQIALGPGGQVYVSANTAGGITTTPNAFAASSGGTGQGAFVARLSSDLATIDQMTYLYGDVGEGTGLAVDSAGSVFVSGYTWDCKMRVHPDGYDTSLAGSTDYFVTKLDPLLSKGGRQVSCYAGPDLAPTITHEDDFITGSQGTYALKVHNDGQGPTTSATTLTVTLPAGLSFVSSSSAGLWSPCSAVGQTVTCSHAATIGAHAATAALSLTVSVTGGAPGVTTSAAVTGGGEPAINQSNNTATDPTTILATMGPITFTVYPRNAGPLSAKHVTITTVIPEDMQFVSATYGGLPTIGMCALQGNRLVCDLGASIELPVNFGSLTNSYYTPSNALAITLSYTSCPEGGIATLSSTISAQEPPDLFGGNNLGSVSKPAPGC